jgi:hypothetical protein
MNGMLRGWEGLIGTYLSSANEIGVSKRNWKSIARTMF